MKERKKEYSLEFKKEAVKLAQKVGFTQTSSDLGLHHSTIRRWQKQASDSGKNTGSGPSKLEEVEAENRRLRKEIVYLKKIGEVLKKSVTIFSSDHIGDLK